MLSSRTRSLLARAACAAAIPVLLALGTVDARAALCLGTNPIKCHVKKGGAGNNFTTIQAAVNAIVSPLTDNYQILVDSQMYSERVTVPSLNTALHNKTIAILCDPVLVATATPINPPVASTAAFVIQSASVTIGGFDIVSTNTVTFGVLVSAPYVTLSSVNVKDAGGHIALAGIAASSWTAIVASSITVAGANAAGLWLQGSTGTAVSLSTAAAKTSTRFALWLDGASSNTFTLFVASNPAGTAAYLSTAADNAVSLSTFTSGAAGAYALDLVNSVANSFVRSYAVNYLGTSVFVSTNSDGNFVSGSTFTSTALNFFALNLTGASTNTVTGSVVVNPKGYGAYLDTNSSSNTLSLSTFTGNAATNYGLFLDGASSNTISQSYAANPAGTGVYLSTDADNNILSGSTVATSAAGFFALNLTNNSSNTISGSRVVNMTGTGAYFSTTSFNTLSGSTFTGNAAGKFALYLFNASSNAVVNSYAANLLGTGVSFSTGSGNNTVSLSTFTSSVLNFFALSLTGASSNTVIGSKIYNSLGHGTYLDTNSNNNTLSLSTFTGNGVGNVGLFLDGASSTSISGSYAANSLGTAVYLDTGALNNTFSGSTVATNAAGFFALNLTNNSSNTFTGGYVFNSAGSAAYLSTTSFDTLDQSTFTASGAAGKFAIALFNASSNTISSSYAFNAAGTAVYLSTDSGGNTIVQSAFAAKTGGYFALNLTNNSTNTIEGSFVSNTAGGGAYFSTGSFDTLDQSTFTGNAAGAACALALYNVDSSTISSSYASNPAGTGVLLSTGSNGNVVSNSTFTSNIANFMGLYLVGASSNAITGSLVSNLKGHAAYLYAGSNANTLSQSTFTSNAAAFDGLVLNAVSSLTITADYVQGTTAVYVSGSTGTEIDGSSLFATGAAGSALQLDRGSSGLTLTGSSLTALSGGAGVYLGAGDGGSIVLSTDIIAGAAYGVLVATPAAGMQVWIASCTIVPATTSGNNTYGLFLDGLMTGATIENNAIYYRTTAAINTRTAYGLYANTCAGLQFEHNEINDPGGVTSGSFYGLYLTNADRVSVKFNDVYSTAPALTAAFLLRAGEGSTNLIVRDNIFFSSFAAPGNLKSSGTVAMTDVQSEAGFTADYNDYFSSNVALGFQWGGSGAQGLLGWRSATGEEGNSISAHPLWFSVAQGAEDFHALSVAGRYDPADGLMDLVDGAQSPTIDAGDPAEPVGLEPAPNGGVVNQGSSGGTAQASESSAQANFPGCVVQRTVSQVLGPYFSIQSAVSSFPQALASQTCAVIEDGATYSEQVTVQNFTMNPGASISIFPDPGSGLTPTLTPPAGTAGFVLSNASVTVTGINLLPTSAVAYGVFVSSPYVQLSGLNVIDPNGRITTAGILASSWTTVSGTSVTVAAAGAAGFWLPGSTMTTISNSSATAKTATRYALWLNGASSSTITAFFANNALGGAAALDLGAGGDFLSLSTFTSNTAGKYGLFLSSAVSAAISGSYVQGTTAAYVAGSTGTAIDGSSFFATAAAGSALQLDRGSIGLTLTGSVLSAPSGGAGVYLGAGDGGSIVLSTDIIAGAAYGVLVATPAAGMQVWITSCTITPALTSNNSTYGLFLDGLMTGATIENDAIYYRTTAAINTRTSYGLYANTCAGLQFDHNEINDPGGVTSGSFYGLYLTNADRVSVKFNDVYSTAPALTAAFLLRAGEGSTNLIVRDNIFFSSFTAPGNNKSTGTVAVTDAQSEPGFSADYNDYFSSNTAMGFQWGPSGTQGLPGWRAATGTEGNSITAHPLWFSVAAGAEDFHALSVTGRYDPADGLMDLVDGAQSPTIDAGDPAEPAGLEPAPNGGAVNQGSSGGTAQASESSAQANFPGCVVQRTVSQVLGPYFSIQSAVSSIPQALASQACAVIEDDATYSEQVTVQNFTMNPGASISIFADPGSGLTPTLTPPAGTAGFVLSNASVTVTGINLLPTSAVTYGVFISSPYVQLAGVNVIDPNGRITTAGILASSWTTVSAASVTVAAAGAAGFWLPGSTMTTISNSSATAKTATRYALWLNGASSSTITAFFANNTLGGAAALDLGAGGDSLSLSTFTSNTAARYGLLLSSAVSAAISGSYVQGTTAAYVAGSTGTAIDGSAFFATAAAGSALQLDRGSIGLTLTGSALSAPSGGAGVYLGAGDGGSLILSTDSVSGAAYGVLVATAAAGTQVWITSCTITPALTSSNNTYGLFLDGLMTGATIENDAIYYRAAATNILTRTSYGLYANTCGGLQFDHNEVNEPGAILGGSFYGAFLTNADRVSFKFNTLYSSAPALTAAFLLRAGEGSTNMIVKDDVFFSSFTAPTAGNSTGTVAVTDLASRAGFVADYNDYFSSNAATGFQWGAGAGAGAQGLGGWQAATGQEADSISAHPLLFSVTAGAEDFHALSVVGRWSAATQSRSLVDEAQSPTIDAGDPAEAAAAESDPLTATVNQGSNGGTAQASLGAPAPASFALAAIRLSSEAASFATVGASAYSVEASTAQDFTGALFSSNTAAGAVLLAPQGLDPNTTYYLRASAQYAGGKIYAPTVLTAATLAAPPTAGALEFLSVQTASVTVAWIAPWEPFVSSMSNEGYVLQASSDDFGAIALPAPAPVFSSSSFNSFSSTLTVGAAGAPLDLGNTYYFQVASLNWAGLPSTATFTRLNFQLQQSTGLIHFGAMDPNVARSSVSTSSMVVTNIGNWPATIELSASTATLPSSPWGLGTAPGLETAVLMGLWYGGPVGPPGSAFTTFLTTTPAVSQAPGNYSSSSPPGNAQNGVQLAPGASVTLWVQFFMPTQSTSVGPELFQTTVQPLYP